MPRTIGILLFDGAEEMDFVGPWEVFTAALSGMLSDRVVTIAERSRPITYEKGMRVIPDPSYEEVTGVDVVVVPGGSGARRVMANAATTNWLRSAAAKCTWLTSVCTGAFLLVAPAWHSGDAYPRTTILSTTCGRREARRLWRASASSATAIS
jgi:putative intracellular protease/amidase